MLNELAEDEVRKIGEALAASKIVAVTELAAEVSRQSFQLVRDVAKIALESEAPKSAADANGRRRPDGLMMIGFDKTIVAPRSHVHVVGRPQVIYKLRHIFVRPEIAKKVTILDIKVGKNSQLVSASPIQTEVFCNLGMLTLQIDACLPGMFITLGIQNDTDEPVEFEATGFGEGVW